MTGGKTRNDKLYTMLQLWPVWTLQVRLPLTKEIEVNGTTSNPTLSNRVSTVRWKPLRQRVPTVGNGETIA